MKSSIYFVLFVVGLINAAHDEFGIVKAFSVTSSVRNLGRAPWTQQPQIPSCLSMAQPSQDDAWDNDDFLESLSRNNMPSDSNNKSKKPGVGLNGGVDSFLDNLTRNSRGDKESISSEQPKVSPTVDFEKWELDGEAFQ
jgi:hypothetical protein